MYPEAAEFDILVMRQRYRARGAQTENATAIWLSITVDSTKTPERAWDRLVVLIAGCDGGARPHVLLSANPENAGPTWRRYLAANPNRAIRRTLTDHAGPVAVLRESRAALGPWWPLVQQQLAQALLPFRHAGREARARRWRTQATNRFLAAI